MCRFRSRIHPTANTWGGVAQKGYLIGRPHPPHTEVRVVRSVSRATAGYMAECAEGEPGQLVVQVEQLAPPLPDGWRP